MASRTICFTGHRPKDMHGYQEDNRNNLRIKTWLHNQITNVAKKYPDAHFISGGALGIDTWAAEAVIEVRKDYPGITLEIAAPCYEQDSRWPAPSKERYRRICDLADKVTYVTEAPYTRECMQKRNEYMVDNADGVIGVWKGTYSGGTWNCLRYAQEQGRPVVLLHPFKFKQLVRRRGEPISKTQ